MCLSDCYAVTLSMIVTFLLITVWLEAIGQSLMLELIDVAVCITSIVFMLHVAILSFVFISTICPFIV